MLNNAMDDEVPLTEIKQNVAVATRDNFDELLQTVLNNQKKKKKKDLKKLKEKCSGKPIGTEVDPSSEVKQTDTDKEQQRYVDSIYESSEMLISNNNLVSSDEDDSTSKMSNDSNVFMCTNSPSLKYEEIHSDLKLPSSPLQMVPIAKSFKKPVPLPRIKTQATAEVFESVSKNIKGNELVEVKTPRKYSRTLEGDNLQRLNDDITEAPNNVPQCFGIHKVNDLSEGSYYKGYKNNIIAKDSNETSYFKEEVDNMHSIKSLNLNTKDSASYTKKKRKHSKSRIQEDCEVIVVPGTSGLNEYSEHQNTIYEEIVNKDAVQSNADCSVKKDENVLTEKWSYSKIVGIFIHKCDYLKIDHHIRHPIVKVHLVDAISGEYLKKTNKNQCVSLYYENENLDYILPVMTKAFDFKERRTLTPSWEELLIFNEDLEYVTNFETKTIIFFEIMDFINISIASRQYERLGQNGAWHKIAWAFLKPSGANNTLNTEKKVRLQLYKPDNLKPSGFNICDVYFCWMKGCWDVYPSTLHVTIKGITPPDNLPPVLRSQFALQGEFSLPFEESKGKTELKYEDEDSYTQQSSIRDIQWSKMPGQSCKIPNYCIAKLGPLPRGSCLSLAFNNSGTLLACGIGYIDSWDISIYRIPDGNKYVDLKSHQGLIYEINWSANDKYIISASADFSACVWSVTHKTSQPKQVLPHPSFVYTAQFHPVKSSIIATGCYDKVVRLWTKPSKVSDYELTGELQGHVGFVTSLVFDKKYCLISSDSSGKIIFWSKISLKKYSSPVKLERELDIRELRGITVNCIRLHPGGKRLLIHARDSILRMLDLSTGSIIHRFKGALNERLQMTACISPCGGLVFSASEDGIIAVWNADTGDQIAIYSDLPFGGTMGVATSTVAYHPLDHIAAFASHSSFSYILVCFFNRHESSSLGLQYLKNQRNLILSPEEEQGHEEEHDPFQKSLTSLSISKGFQSMTHSLMSIGLHKKVDKESENSVDGTANTKEYTLQNVEDSNSIRLTNIIGQIDRVLSNTPSKSSTQLSISPKSH